MNSGRGHRTGLGQNTQGETSFMNEAFTTPGADQARTLMLLGSGELGKEVIIEAQRLGLETIAVDRYADAPAMQVAHRSEVIDMLDGAALRAVIERHSPDLVVPEIEAIHTDTLLAMEAEGLRVIPTASATRLTMDREGIRRLAAEHCDIETSAYRFVDTLDEYRQAIEELGLPVVIKPVMSSSGKGQSTILVQTQIEEAWAEAQSGGRTGAGRCIVESFVPFDYEITLLTVCHVGGTSFCEPIGHRQEEGDYRESWQPQPMSPAARRKAEQIAGRITAELGGRGVFGVELFVRGDEVIFSEVSPRPHDTGMVTMISQDLSQFALHVRAICDLPIPEIHQRGPSASSVILVDGHGRFPRFHGVDAALSEPHTEIRLFGKPAVAGRRRLGVCLARADSIEDARATANRASQAIRVELSESG